MRLFNFTHHFFTWVNNIKNYLWWIFESVLKHSNVLGKREFSKNEKNITISIKREFNELDGHAKIYLIIRDNKSYLLKPPDVFMEELKNSSEYVWRLRGLADWQIHCYHPKHQGLSFNILSNQKPAWSKNENVGEYFEQIITFYD